MNLHDSPKGRGVLSLDGIDRISQVTGQRGRKARFASRTAAREQ
jgi:hypothetical protein